MKRLSLLTLAFAVCSVIFLNLLIVLRIPFPLYPLISYQDAFDLLTPLVLIPIYWLLYRFSGDGQTSPAEEVAFMVCAAIWVMGHGMHLSANSIDNLAEALAKKHVLDITATTIYQLDYFFDEQLGHYVWHIGTLALTAVLLWREWRKPAGLRTLWRAAGMAGLLYGFTYFAIFIEGQTVLLGLPFAVAVVLLALIWGRQRLAQQPVLAFFFIACLVALVLFAGWGVYWRGFPQFSDVGLI